MVDVMNIEITESAAAGPEKAVETGNLPQQFFRFTGPWLGECRPDNALHPVAAHEVDVADLAVLDALVKLLHRMAVAGH